MMNYGSVIEQHIKKRKVSSRPLESERKKKKKKKKWGKKKKKSSFGKEKSWKHLRLKFSDLKPWNGKKQSHNKAGENIESHRLKYVVKIWNFRKNYTAEKLQKTGQNSAVC